MAPNRSQGQSSQLGTGSPMGMGDPENTSNATDFVVREMAQAFKDLARGEETATLIEANLTALERKLDDILAAYEGVETEAVASGDPNSNAEEPTRDPSTGGGPNGSSSAPAEKK